MKYYLINLSKNILLLLLSLFLVAVLGEISMRMFFKDDIVLYPRYHSSGQYGNFIIRKNISNNNYNHSSVEGSWHFQTNSKGFRNTSNFNYEKPLNVLRILSIGDSHIFGYEVSQEETCSTQLEKLLARDSMSVEVINMGVSGFGTSEELVLLENEGINYKPDYIILGFFRNDYDDNIRSNLFRLKKDSLTVSNKKYIPGVKIQDFIYRISFVRWLSENSYLYSFTFNSVWEFFKTLSFDNAHSDSMEYAININQTIGEYQMLLTLKLLERIYEICQKSGIKLIIIDIPSWELDNSIISSIHELMIDSQSPFCDYLIKFEDLKSNLEQNELLRTQGHHHISEKTHKLIAELCTIYIKSQILKGH